ncbi:hypothetical protein KCP75_00935 [Salmonella enterica subsp. enterica]|nr:hypothetical protein KCP75_00935 [Salmonella enterica subsp. enterica]
MTHLGNWIAGVADWRSSARRRFCSPWTLLPIILYLGRPEATPGVRLNSGAFSQRTFYDIPRLPSGLHMTYAVNVAALSWWAKHVSRLPERHC